MKIKSTLILIFLTSILSTTKAQNVGCDGIRYIDHLFDSVKVTLNVKYGEATNLSGSQKELFMDIYEPKTDLIDARPVVILAHGGSFVGGNRTEFAPICEDLAKRGYVAATINYRLIDQLLFDSTAFSEIVVMASLDMKAAVRFFREDAVNDDVYKVDPALIIVGGASAGGVTASHVGLMDSTDIIPEYILNHINNNGGYEGNSNLSNVFYSSEVQSILNYSGSLGRVNFIDANDPPFYSAHDEFDDIVPCGYATSSILPFPVYSYGSCEMHARADILGIENEFTLFEGSNGHVSYFTNGDTAVIRSIIEESVNFIEAVICDVTNKEPEINDNDTASIFDNYFVIDVLSNDSDVDGNIDAQSVRIVNNPSNGTASVNANGTINYTASTGFIGTDSFQYIACDEGSPVLCGKASVFITLMPPVGIFENTYNSNIFEVFPNPSYGNFEVNLTESIPDFTISIYDLAGQIVYTKTGLNSQNFQINKTGLSAGTYILRLKDIHNSAIYNQKIIVF